MVDFSYVVLFTTRCDDADILLARRNICKLSTFWNISKPDNNGLSLWNDARQLAETI